VNEVTRKIEFSENGFAEYGVPFRNVNKRSSKILIENFFHKFLKQIEFHIFLELHVKVSDFKLNFRC
jgi:hypothetical protein